MPDSFVIVVRLVPLVPTDGATFSSYLNGLSLTAYDRRVCNASLTGENDVALGTASGVAPWTYPSGRPIAQVLTITPGSDPPAYENSIVQHYEIVAASQPCERPSATYTAKSAATALIVVNPSSLHHGYANPAGFDVRMVVARSGIPVPMPPLDIEYNVINVISLPSGVDITTLKNTYEWAIGLPASQYVWIPPPLPSGATGAVSVGSASAPPNFYALKTAINAVLAQDFPPTATSLENLTTPLTMAQCSEIASKLTYERYTDAPPDPPLPEFSPLDPPRLPIGIELLYTTPDNTDPTGDSGTPTWDQLRQSWEADWRAYHRTRDANAARLTQYVFAASAAVWAEIQTIQGTAAMVSVPIDSAFNPPSPAELQIFITGQDLKQPLQPCFYVPAVYFYALGAKLPITLSPIDRYKAAVITPLANLGAALQSAIDTGIITEPEPPATLNSGVPALFMPQAARRIAALSARFITGPGPTIKLTGQVSNLIAGWLADGSSVGDFESSFWGGQFASTTPDDSAPSDYLILLLSIIADGNSQLLKAILDLPVKTVGKLISVTDAQWYSLFAANPSLLPQHTLPGNTSRRSAAFIVFLRKLFQPKIFAASQNSLTRISTPTLRFTSDTLQRFISAYLPAGAFSFTGPLNISQVEAALTSAFPGEPVTRGWTLGAVSTINALFSIVTTAAVDPSLQMSYMEALYARGFTSVESVMNISQPQFTAAMVGTVAYGAGGATAGSIWNAVVANPPSTTVTPGSGFQPVNSGSLINCVPPLHLSPLGPCQYLQEMLNTSIGSSTILNLVSKRRGSLGGLAVTKENLQIQIPLIDLVLESLEFMAASAAAPGAVYETNLDGIPGLGKENGLADEIEDLLAAVPQHSTPSLTISRPDVYNTLETCFTSPNLPYSQKLDVCRSYLNRLCSTRFDTMRRFRKDVSEFCLLDVQDSSRAPADFDKTLWRLPVEFDIALEYLQISPAEYKTFYSGSFPAGKVSTFYDLDSTADPNWAQTALKLPAFLHSTGLSYCEFIDLWKCRFVPFSQVADDRMGMGEDFPECAPCCLDKMAINLNLDGDFTQPLMQLSLFIRLWRKLHHQCGLKHITFILLADICDVLGGFFPSGAVNPDFVRQLASMLMLIHYFNLPWGHNPRVAAVGAERTKILGLWSESHGASSNWATDALLKCVGRFAENHFQCDQRGAAYIKILSDNLTSLSSLVGFPQTTRWNAKPTCTIRFAEVLAKIYASKFSIGEILFLFTNAEHLDGDDPFPIGGRSESLEVPLNWPEGDPNGIWELREKLLRVEISEEELEDWSWDKIAATMEELGKKDATATRALGEHFFPETLESQGQQVSAASRRWSSPLSTSQTTPMMWNSEPCRPFRYEQGEQESLDTDTDSAPVFSGELWIQLPLRDEDISRKLRDCRQLRDIEITVVQDLYFAPRAMIAPFALIFSNFNEAVNYMIQEPEESERFRYFQRQFVLFFRRCKTIAEHLVYHVGLMCDCVHKDGCCECEKPEAEVAWMILKSLIADENFTTGSWEDSSGRLPPVSSFQWDPHFSGNAFAALLGLAGTGILGKYSVASDLTWAEMQGRRAEWSTPVLTVIPSLSDPSTFALNGQTNFKNGFIVPGKDGEDIGSTQSFSAISKGQLLVDCEGHYKFKASHPMSEHHPECHQEFGQIWLVTVERGRKRWAILNHCSSGPPAPPCESSPLCLARGAYTITVEFHQNPPEKDRREEMERFHSGLELEYEGPDTQGSLVTIPLHRLIQNWKTENPLEIPAQRDDAATNGISSAIITSTTAKQFLDLQYISTLRDIRRTYQRAFKAILFATRFRLSAQAIDWQSELRFILDYPHRFRGSAYELLSTGQVTSSHVNFDFNFFPVLDPFSPPETPDTRADPSMVRQAALFDWWERLFDYTTLRSRTREKSSRDLWLLFEEAARQVHLSQPSSENQRTKQLLCHLGVSLDISGLLTTYFAPALKHLSPSDLLDERWPIRVMHADPYIQVLQKAFFTEHITKATPSLWASDDPSVTISGDSGNKNLVTFLQQSLLESHDISRDIKGLKDINNGLRCRARKALFAYLCGMSRVSLSPLGLKTSATSPQDLTDLLLQDVEVGPDERSSRIDDAIHSTQMLAQRARIGLEPDWTYELSELWESRYSAFGIWSAFKRRQVYLENWLHWDEMQKLKNFESAKIFTKQLDSGDLSTLEHDHPLWREFATLKLQHDSLPEGLSLMSLPTRDERPNAPTLSEDLTGSSWSSGSEGTTNLHNRKKPTVSESKISTAPRSNEIESGLASLKEIPLWITALIKKGTQFFRVAAASQGPWLPHEGSVDAGVVYCHRCGQIHESCMDEYYFWLQHSSTYRYQDIGDPPTGTVSQYIQNADINTKPGAVINAVDPDSDWNAVDKLPGLLRWPPQPTVYLFWARVHMGTLDPPRRSDEGIFAAAPPGISTILIPDLTFGGRIHDSLYFHVSNTREYLSDGAGIFRYDIATDAVTVVTSQPSPPTPSPSTPLNLYPWFIHFAPGRPLFPVSGFEVALSIADSYRGKCSWEKALKWCRVAFDPLNRDNTWMPCAKAGPTDLKSHVTSIWYNAASHSPGNTHAVTPTPTITLSEMEEKLLANPTIRRNIPCCPCLPVEGPIVRGRAAIMSFLRTLLEWADSLMSRGSMENAQQALVIYDFMHRLLGPTPPTVNVDDVFDSQMTIATFVASHPPLNPELMLFYEEVADRRRVIHNSANRRKLSTNELHRRLAPWSSHREWDARSKHSICGEDLKCFSSSQPYRYAALHGKAVEWVNMVKSLGSSLLSAYEKGDNELLATVRETQQRQILDLGLEVSKNQWRVADWDYQALDRSMESALTQLRYYQGLLQAGLNMGENGFVANIGISVQSGVAAQVSNGIAQANAIEPDPYMGNAGVYGSPISIITTPGGSKLASIATSAARVLNGMTGGANTLAGLLNAQGSWDRRAQGWKHQVDIITLEIQQIKRHILTSERRRDIALRELNIHQRKIEHSAEVINFLQDKFTKHELYLFLQHETAALYKQCYSLALKAAKDAQQAFCLHEGLMAGERLDLALHAMDQSYMRLNYREYELTKNFSLRLHFPLAFLELKTYGSCEVDIPEWMLDLDYPSHYMRRIKNITLSIPHDTDPCNGMHCRVELLSSCIRYNPLIPGPEACSCPPKLRSHCGHDPFLIKRYNGTEAIAVSDALDDDGLFELNFRDERYLPFEFCGAVSKWKIELPPENNAFDLENLTDFTIKLNYTAREGGSKLAKAKNELIRERVPGNGLRYFEISREFPHAWHAFARIQDADEDRHKGGKRESKIADEDELERDFELDFTRNMFPFLTYHRSVIIERIHIFIETEEHCGDHIRIKHVPARKSKHCDEDDMDKDIVCRIGAKCYAGGERKEADYRDEGCVDREGEKERTKEFCEGKVEQCCCGTMFHGILEMRIGPLETRQSEKESVVKLKLPRDLQGVREVYLVCEYAAEEKQEKGLCCGKEGIIKRLSVC